MSAYRVLLMSAIIGLFGFLTGAVLFSQREAQRRVPEVVKARQFQLVDTEGRVRAELGLPFGEPTLFLYDKEGRPRAWLTLERDGNPRIMFVDKDDQSLWQAPPVAPAPPAQSNPNP